MDLIVDSTIYMTLFTKQWYALLTRRFKTGFIMLSRTRTYFTSSYASGGRGYLATNLTNLSNTIG